MAFWCILFMRVLMLDFGIKVIQHIIVVEECYGKG